MNLAGKCQGFFHCHSLSAWSSHDTIVIAVIVIIVAFLGLVLGKR